MELIMGGIGQGVEVNVFGGVWVNNGGGGDSNVGGGASLLLLYLTMDTPDLV